MDIYFRKYYTNITVQISRTKMDGLELQVLKNCSKSKPGEQPFIENNSVLFSVKRHSVGVHPPCLSKESSTKTYSTLEYWLA